MVKGCGQEHQTGTPGRIWARGGSSEAEATSSSGMWCHVLVSDAEIRMGSSSVALSVFHSPHAHQLPMSRLARAIMLQPSKMHLQSPALLCHFWLNRRRQLYYVSYVCTYKSRLSPAENQPLLARPP